MSKTNNFETDALELIFTNTPMAGGSWTLMGSPAEGSLYIALFTADPTETGSLTNEATYTGYTRLAINRVSAGWTVASGSASNTSTVYFGQCTAGSETITHFAIVTTLTGSATGGGPTVLYSAALDAPEAVTVGVTPSFAAGTLIVTED